MEGTYETNRRYRDLRDAFILENEEFRPTVYFDHRGIPTFSKGVALLTPRKKAKNDKRPGTPFDRHDQNIRICRKILGEKSEMEKSLENFADVALRAIDHTDEPVYPVIKKKTVRKVSFFQTTPRGRQLVRLVGPLNGKWESSRSPTVSVSQGEDVYAAAIDEREVILEKKLKKTGIDPSKLTEEQRIALVDAVYHGRWGKKSVLAARAMISGKSINEICQYLYNQQFPDRTKKVAQLLNKTWQPSKSSKKIPPSRSVQEPGISPEQLSILREYLLSEALTQHAGMSAYEQIVMRYMGAGCDFPLKHLCDPYSEIVRRYGD